MKKRSKIVVIGTGYVGASICYTLMLKDVAQEIVLIDSDIEKARGEALDIAHGIPHMSTSIIYQGEYSDCKDCDMVIITAGKGRKSEQKRSDLFQENVQILSEIADRVKKHYNGGVILIVSNPVDAMTQEFTKWMGLPDGRVFGTGCVLDVSRLMSLLARYVGVPSTNIRAVVIGEHGETQFPLWNRVTVSNIPIGEYCEMMKIPWNDDVKKDLIQQMHEMGAEIIKKKGKTSYGIAACVAYLAEAVIHNQMIVESVTSVLQGECGIKDVAVSVPSLIGENGVEKRLIEDLDLEQIEYLRKNCKRW